MQRHPNICWNQDQPFSRKTRKLIRTLKTFTKEVSEIYMFLGASRLTLKRLAIISRVKAFAWNFLIKKAIIVENNYYSPKISPAAKVKLFTTRFSTFISLLSSIKLVYNVPSSPGRGVFFNESLSKLSIENVLGSWKIWSRLSCRDIWCSIKRNRVRLGEEEPRVSYLSSIISRNC